MLVWEAKACADQDSVVPCGLGSLLASGASEPLDSFFVVDGNVSERPNPKAALCMSYRCPLGLIAESALVAEASICSVE